MEEEIRKEFMEMIKLLEEGRLQEFKQKATECPPVDIAEGLEEIEDEGRVLRVFRMLPKDISSDVFSYMTSEQQQLIAESATNAELKALASALGEAFRSDTGSINNGYPILSWQASILLGDVNMDGKVSLGDAVLLYAYVRGKTKLSAEQLSCCDLNDDGGSFGIS